MQPYSRDTAASRAPCVVSLRLCPSWCFLSLWRGRQIRRREDSRKKHGPHSTRHETALLTMVAQPFPFFFVQTNAWINWRSPSKASICISLGIINPANADGAHKEVRKEKCTFGICVQEKERLGERREWQARGGKTSPIVNNSKTVKLLGRSRCEARTSQSGVCFSRRTSPRARLR